MLVCARAWAQDGIKPDIEHEANVGGGKWTLRLRKGLSSRLFEGATAPA